jgi:outer membrane lipoprotein-sorting protein
MKKIISAALLLAAGVFVSVSLHAEDVLSIVRKLDTNQVYSTMKAEAELQIRFGGKKIVKQFKLLGKGDRNSFVEFTNPEDAGTKFLKKDGNLFLYSPDAEQIIPITGHMLKESMMGSDLSYEDTVANDTLESLYNSSIIEESDYDGKACWVLELVGKKKTISYPKLRMWVEKTSFIPLLTDRFALSGALLKEERVLETKLIGTRMFATKMEVKDLLRKDSSTLFVLGNVELDVPIADSVFSMKNLER